MLWAGLAILVTALTGVWWGTRISRIFFCTEPAAGPPCAFGYKMAWIAVKTRDTARLVETLRLKNVRSVSWMSGIRAIYNERTAGNRVFVTPPVDGWSFVAGVSLPLPMGDGFEDKCSALMAEISREFGLAQFYVSHPGIEFFGWMTCADGHVLRAFACGAEGVVWNRGAVTGDERSLAVPLFQLRTVEVDGREREERAIGEKDVMALAQCWSVDPTLLDGREDAGAGVGYVAAAPHAWRVAPASRQAA